MFILKKINFVVSLLLVLQVLNSKSYAGPGFYNIQQAPLAVQEAARSVFRIYVPAGQLIQTYSVADTQAAISRIDFEKRQGNNWAAAQLEQCLKVKSESPQQTQCPVFSGWSQGTSFLLDKNTSMYTAFHVMDSFLTGLAEVKGFVRTNRIDRLEGLIPSFGVLDYQNKSPAVYASGMAKIDLFNPDVRLYTDAKDNTMTPFEMVSDAIRMQYTQSGFTLPLNPASGYIQDDSILYVVGYPSPSEDRQDVGAPDSNGKQIYVSGGRKLSSESFRRKYQNSNIPQNLFENLIAFTNADCHPGNSGGPVLTAEGKFVGILIASSGRWTENSQQTCIVLDARDEAKLKYTWSQLSQLESSNMAQNTTNNIDPESTLHFYNKPTVWQPDADNNNSIESLERQKNLQKIYRVLKARPQILEQVLEAYKNNY